MEFRGMKKGALALVVGMLAFGSQAQASDTYGSSAPSTTAAPVVVAQASSQAANLVSGRISQAVSNATGSIAVGTGKKAEIISGGGKAAGDSIDKMAFWANAAGTWIENDQSGVNFKGNIVTSVVGADYLVTDKVLAGVSVGYERPDIRTTFNNGTFKGNNWSIAPYAAYIINDTFSVDAMAGYAWVSYDMTRAYGSISGSTEGHRLFGGANVNANTAVDHWRLGSSLGYLYTTETQGAYTEKGTNGSTVGESQMRLGQARLSGKAGYAIQEAWGSMTPYGSARLEFDVNHTPTGIADADGTPVSNDRFGTTFAIGNDLSIGNSTSLNLEATTTQFREHIQLYGLSGSVRVKF